ncbi:MAG: carbohydrate ABC transporter permease [Lachnospiraceae bacterium]
MAKFEEGSTVKVSASDRVLSVVCYLFVTIFALACLFPFILVITSSFTDEVTLAKEGYRIIASKWSLDAYRLVFQTDQIFNAYKVTIFVTVVGTVLSMLCTSAMSYALSVKSLKLRGRLAFFVYFTMLFNGGLVPSYLLISKYLGMRDTIWVFIIPALVNAWNMLLLRNFFADIPESLAESARIDGANDIYILFKIILPISLPAIATIGLFYALAYWNEWYKALLYIDNEKLYTLQYLIMKILRQANFAAQIGGNYAGALPTYTVRMATVVVAIGPIILLYPFLQKYFVAGLTVGSVKG